MNILDNAPLSPWLICEQACLWLQITQAWSIFVCPYGIMCYENSDALGGYFCGFLSPKALLLTSNLHAFGGQEHAYCPTKWCFLQRHLIVFHEKERFFSQTICCLLLVCLLIFSILKVFNCRFRAFFLIKNRTIRRGVIHHVPPPLAWKEQRLTVGPWFIANLFWRPASCNSNETDVVSLSHSCIVIII